MAKANETKKATTPKAITVQPMDRAGNPQPITEANWLRLTAANGKKLEVSPSLLSSALLPVLALHGLKQKLIDAAAISRNTDTGLSATVDDKWSAVVAVWERLTQGEWNAARGEGGGPGGLLFKALCRMQPTKAPEAIKAWLDGKSDKEQAALRLNPKVAAVIETIRAEQVTEEAAEQAEDALEELENLGNEEEGEGE